MGDVIDLKPKAPLPVAGNEAEAAPAPDAEAPAPAADEDIDWRAHYAQMSDGELQREFEKLGAEVGHGFKMWLDFFAEPEKPLLKRLGRFFT